MMKYLDDTEDAGQPESTRVINLPSAAGSGSEG